MSENGWVKVYRKIIEKGYYKRSHYVHLWLHLLLKASHEEKEFMWNGKIEKLLPGQFVTGRNSLSKDTGIPSSTVEDILNVFETEHQIRQQKNNKFRLLTVLNWGEYQEVRQVKQQLADIQPTSSQQLADTFKNIKNDKNERIKEKDIDIFSEHLLTVLKIPMSDKGITDGLIKSFGLDNMIGAVNRMKIYFDTVKQNKWTEYIIGKHWRNLYEKMEYFSSDENIEKKIADTRRANTKSGKGVPAVIIHDGAWEKEHHYDDSISVRNDGRDKVVEMVALYEANTDKLSTTDMAVLKEWKIELGEK